jgi:hypothetical protein
MTSLYNAEIKLNTDKCWMNAKDTNNNKIEKYSLYYNDTSKKDTEYGSFPSMSYDHVNLHGRTGYGVTDDYLIDVYSSLRNSKDIMTRDRCPVQLSTRIFAGGPKLTGICRNINTELDIMCGNDTKLTPNDNSREEVIKSVESQNGVCNKHIMEKTTYNFIPLLDCVKEVQNPQHIVPDWTRGGDDSRSYVNKQKYNRCNRK